MNCMTTKRKYRKIVSNELFIIALTIEERNSFHVRAMVERERGNNKKYLKYKDK